MHKLRIDGYYATEPVPWEDWHAGVRMHGIRFHYRRFYPDGYWFGCYRAQPFDFWRFSESVDKHWKLTVNDNGLGPQMKGEGDPAYMAGVFLFEEGCLNLIMRDSIGFGQQWEFPFEIRREEIVQLSEGKALMSFRFYPANFGVS